MTNHAAERLKERYFPSVSKKRCKRWLKQQCDAGRALLLAGGKYQDCARFRGPWHALFGIETWGGMIWLLCGLNEDKLEATVITVLANWQVLKVAL